MQGKFAQIEVIVGPASNDIVGLEFHNETKGGVLPKEYIKAVEKGFKEAMANGPVASFQMYNLKVCLINGSYHEVDSDSLSFEIAARKAFRDATQKAGAVIYEPFMNGEIITPDEYLGYVIADLNKRRADIYKIDATATIKIISFKVPLSEMFGYVTALRTLSQGRGTITMEFSHYEPVPNLLAQKIIDIAKGKIEIFFID